MDRISSLSDDLLLNILSSLPAKDVVATTLLSKRWKFLWTMVPKLDFDDNFEFECDEDYGSYDCNGYPSKYGGGFRQFVDRVMVLHKAPVLETLKLDVGPWCNSEDIAHWIRIGIVRHVRELEVSHSLGYYEDHESIRLPESLFTYAKLEVLKLSNTIFLDVPTAIYLPSLKSLHLLCVEYKSKDSHHKLLSGCPVLEELVVDRSKNSYLSCYYVAVPSLERLSIFDKWYDEPEDCVQKMVINAPSLKYLNIVDTYSRGLLCLSENMPGVVEAKVNVVYTNPKKLMGSLTSVKRLSLCLSTSMLQHHIGFYQLVHLELCVGAPQWWDLLTWMLEISPKLQVLKLDNNCNGRCGHTERIEGRWRQPCSVPECLVLHLNTFEWKYYNGRRQEKKLMAYILKNARQLKTASFSSWELTLDEGSFELVSLPRASSSCQILLD